MSFEDRKKQAEDFADFSANVGIAFLISKFFAMIFGGIFSFLKDPIVSFRWNLFMFYQWLFGSYIDYRRSVALFKAVGVQCPTCKCWVSAYVDCPVCGTDVKMRSFPENYFDYAGGDADHWTTYGRDNFHDLVTMLFEHHLARIKSRRNSTCSEEFMRKYAYTEDIRIYTYVGALYHNFFTFCNRNDSYMSDKDIRNEGTFKMMPGWGHSLFPKFVYSTIVNNSVEKDKLLYACAYIFKWKPKHPDEYTWMQNAYFAGYGFEIKHIHLQEETRQKYEKVRCPACNGLSKPVAYNADVQKRTCSSCGHVFEYSSNYERMLKNKKTS